MPNIYAASPSRPRFAALLDIDGTIVHTLPVHLDAWRQTITRNGGTVNEGTFFNDVTKFPSRQIVKNFFPGPEGAPGEIERILNEKVDLYRQTAAQRLDELVVPGFREFFAALKTGGIPAGIVTSLEHEEFDFILSGLGIADKLDTIVSAADVAKHKPSPAPYLVGAAHLNFDPSQCVGFEDSPTGIKSINAADGMKCVVVGTSLKGLQFAEMGLKHDLYIKDYIGLTLGRLSKMFFK